MFSAPKMRWLLRPAAADVPIRRRRVGTVDAWLIWRLTGGARHADRGRQRVTDPALRHRRSCLVRRAAGAVRRAGGRRCPRSGASNAGFGTTAGVPGLPDGMPILAVLADSHAALYGQGCTRARDGQGDLRHRLLGDDAGRIVRRRQSPVPRPWPG